MHRTFPEWEKTLLNFTPKVSLRVKSNRKVSVPSKEIWLLTWKLHDWQLTKECSRWIRLSQKHPELLHKCTPLCLATFTVVLECTSDSYFSPTSFVLRFFPVTSFRLELCILISRGTCTTLNYLKI